MPIISSLRSRWPRRLVFIAIACAAIYWAELQYQASSSPQKTTANIDQASGELQPSLTKAREIPTANLDHKWQVNKPNWDPQPQWRHELNGSWGAIARPSSATSQLSPSIPEEYPREPRFKKGPPVMGNAMADSSHTNQPSRFERAIGQPASNPSILSKVAPTFQSSEAVATVSPFRTTPVQQLPLPRNDPSQLSSTALATRYAQPHAELGSPDSAWPDQTFTPKPSMLAEDRPSQSPWNSLPSPPNLLTNARVSNAPSPSSEPTRQSSAKYTPAPSQSPQFIVQPKRP